MYNTDVYDFDGTIYNGDSSKDFFLFCLKKNKKILKYIPKIIFYIILHFFGIISTTKYKEKFFSFLQGIDNISIYVCHFWKKNNYKINKFFLENIKKSQYNYVISASPYFLLNGYLKQFNNVKLIATNMDYKGNIVGGNCKGVEKVNRLLKENIKIKKFFSDSIDDQPLTEISEKSYYVKNGNVTDWQLNNIKLSNEKKWCKILFILFFTFYLILGILLSFNYDFTNNFDLLFDSDAKRVIDDMSNITGEHYRLSVHPLFVLFIQPIFFIISGITQNKMLSLIILSALTSAINVVMIYKFATLYSKNNKINLLISICFGFCFSNIIFTAGIEVYNIAILPLIILWYFLAKILNGQDMQKNDYYVFGFLGLLSLSITVTNYIIFLIVCFILLISKKVPLKKLFLINFFVIIIFLALSFFQNYIWHNTPIFTNSVFDVVGTETTYADNHISIKNVKNVIKNDFFNSVLASDIYVTKLKYNNNPSIQFSNISKYNLIIISILFIYLLFSIMKKFKKNLYINVGVLLSLLFNFLFHLIYGNDASFLYSLHFLYLNFLLLIINWQSISLNKYKYFIIFLFLLLISEILSNGYIFIRILKIVSTILTSNYFILNFSFLQLFVILLSFILIIYSAIYLFFIVFMKWKNNKGEWELIKLFLIFILIECIFVSINTIPIYNKILFFNI